MTAAPAAARSNEFPTGIPYIVANEGAERFSFYGMRQILYVYMTALLIRFVSEDQVDPELLAQAKVRATQVTHVFMAGVYAVPMIGAILADRLLGKYRVIFWVSLIYVAGHGVLAMAGRLGAMGSFGPAEAAVYAGLGLVAVGSGGIKPCVSANVGDQFSERNGHLVSRVFQIFYFMINFGSFFATLLTPWLYKNVGAEVAFGVPGVLMAVAALVFWLGRDRFVRVPPRPGGHLGLLDFVASALLFAPIAAVVVGFVLQDAHPELPKDAGFATQLGVILRSFGDVLWPGVGYGLAAAAVGIGLFAWRQRLAADTGFLAILVYCLRHRGERLPGQGFFSVARARFGDEAAEGPPAVLRIMGVFSMVSVFWALFDQHSSTWVEQAKQMDRTFDAPLWLFSRFAVPATVALALFGLFWLLRWVSNKPLPASWNRAAIGTVGAWGLLMAGIQLTTGDTVPIEMQPAQIASLNPLMVMMIIPTLDLLVYRPLEKRGRPLRPLQRMTIGMFLASLSFVAVAVLQQSIEAAPKGSVPVLWQVIPYLIITAAEVLVSVTGLEFAYTQAPRAMKSTIMGFWLLLVFAGLMAGAASIFLVLAWLYKGRTWLQQEA